MSINGKRLYVGRLSRDATRRDVEDFFAKAGPLIDIRVMQGFGFVEFESPRDAEEAVATLSGRDLLGESITLDYARDTRGQRRDDPYGAPRGYGGPPAFGGGGSRAPPREGRGRLLIQDLPRDVSWQDLKDFGREGGPVSYADLDRDVPGQGIIEYPSVPDAEDAAKRLEGLQIRGSPVVVVIDSPRGGGYGGGGGGGYPPPPRDADPYGRRDDRGYDRRDDYRRDDRDYYGGARRDDYYDRAPPPRRDERDYRRDDRDYRPREDYPPRRDEPRRDYDDRRPASYDQRRERSPPPRQRTRSPAPAGGEAPREAAPAQHEERAQEGGAPAQGGADAWN